MKSQWESLLNNLKQKLEELLKSEKIKFKDVVSINDRIGIGEVPKKPGVYVIYENNKIIYVGSSGKGKANLKTRLRELFYYNKRAFPNKENPSEPFNHTLTSKLVNDAGRFVHPDEVRKFYLDECSFRFIETETVREARALECILILQLNPIHND